MANGRNARRRLRELPPKVRHLSAHRVRRLHAEAKRAGDAVTRAYCERIIEARHA